MGFVKCPKCKCKRYSGIKECDCETDGVLVVNEGDVTKEQLRKLANQAWKGTGVLLINFKSGVNWLCSTGWKGEATWLKTDNKGVWMWDGKHWLELFNNKLKGRQYNQTATEIQEVY